MEILNNILEKISFIKDVSFLGFLLTNILTSIAILVFFIISRHLIKKLIIKKISLILSFSETKIKEAFLVSIEKPLEFFVVSVGVFASSSLLTASQKINFFLQNINLSLFTISIFWLISKTIEPFSRKIKNLKTILTKDLLDWLISAVKIIIFILGFSAVLEVWGIKVGPIIAGLGLFGVAVALGAQDLFKNLISGILVLVEKRFKKGDVVMIESIIEGTVEKIGFRSTAIRKFDKSLCFIPNYQFAENAVVNITEISNRRINWIIGVEYKTTIIQLKNICSDIESSIRRNKEEFIVSESTPVIVKINEFAPSSIDILVRCFTKTNNYNKFIKAKDGLAVEIKKIIEKRRCSFAFPSQSLYIEK